MEAVCIFNPSGAAPLVLTCEHASCTVPVEYDNLGLDEEDLREHIGWDIGARAVTEALARQFDAPAVLAGVSRLVIDCNRDLADHDLIVAESDGIRVPGNTRIDAAERERRIHEFYEPYHATIDGVMAQRPGALLLSVHSFTPSLNGRERRFDVGVLFDAFATEAEQVGEALSKSGLRVRYNEPYSGLDGLIFSARTHGMRHNVRYLELELNNRRLRAPADAAAVTAAVGQALSRCLER
jgi:predicted N-formylglutamate amidohydrolase